MVEANPAVLESRHFAVLIAGVGLVFRTNKVRDRMRFTNRDAVDVRIAIKIMRGNS